MIIGYPIAYIISRESPKREYNDINVCYTYVDEFLLRTYAWLTILGRNGIINIFISKLGFEALNFLYNDNAVLLGMVYNFAIYGFAYIFSIVKNRNELN